MEILNKLQALSESLGQGKESVEQVKSDVEAFGQAKFDEGKLAGIEEGKVIGFEEGKKIGYDEGFAAGVASVGGELPPPSDKIYSQVELDEKIVVAKAEVKAELKALYKDAQDKESAIEAALFAEPVVEPVV
ncbi:MAG: hypothetical protein BWZ03_00259 [bacterium ADurb.BinA186]|nr:MAG: hypothetical protein BWZ03_00259 [bacterium ADurb.BinA186]